MRPCTPSPSDPLDFHDRPAVSFDDTALVERIVASSDSFEAYGYRRIQDALRHQGFVVNHKNCDD